MMRAVIILNDIRYVKSLVKYEHTKTHLSHKILPFKFYSNSSFSTTVFPPI